MAIQHTKADGTQTANGDIPVVAPMNIGKGLLWDPATKTYYVAIDDRTFEVDELGRLKLRVSTLEDNQLQLRDDGIYQGKTSNNPSLFVDYLNGSDDNVGTVESPLKTIIAAIKKITNGTNRNVIYIKENQTHKIIVPNNGYIIADASFAIRPYGSVLDEMRGRWNEPKTGWHVFSAKEYAPYKPIIEVDPSFQIAPAAGSNTYSPSWLYVDGGNYIDFVGVQLGVSYGNKDAHINEGWNSMFLGRGTFQFIDCYIRNANNNGTWTLVDDHDGEITTQYRLVTLQSTDPKDAITGISKKMNVEIEEGRLVESPHSSGLTWATSTRKEDIKASVRGANNITPTSTNYITNV